MAAHRKARPTLLPTLNWRRPAAHAIVLSVDEKSQIQALDRTQPVA
jgi:hypothetical protein